MGSPAPRKLDIRFIAATNKDLRTLVREQRFREDLYYRLSMVEITLPGLVERKEDLSLLQTYFLEKFAALYNKPVHGITRRAQALLSRHDWPGNVRELENVLGKACMMAEGATIDVRDLPVYLRKVPVLVPAADDDLISLEELEERHVVRVLKRVGGDKSRAAEVLGISRTTLYKILSRIEPARTVN